MLSRALGLRALVLVTCDPVPDWWLLEIPGPSRGLVQQADDAWDMLLQLPAATDTASSSLERERAEGGVWGHTVGLLGGQLRVGRLIMCPSHTRSVHTCWVSAALTSSTVGGLHLITWRVHLRDTLVPRPVGRSCSSDPRWPWPMKGTTMSCAGSRRGPGAGESLTHNV